MNASVKQALVAATLVLVVAGPASAVTSNGLYADVQSAISGSGNVNVSMKDGVATLTGYADTASKAATERAALASPDVSRVINLVQQDG